MILVDKLGVQDSGRFSGRKGVGTPLPAIGAEQLMQMDLWFVTRKECSTGKAGEVPKCN